MILPRLSAVVLANCALVPSFTNALAHSNVSIKLFQSTGQVKVVTSEQFYSDIVDLTNRSNAINTIAQGITVVNGPLGVLGLGPYPQVIQGMADLVTAAQSYLLTIYATPKIYDAVTVTNITAAYQDFIIAHSALMQTLITRAGLFTVVPAIGNSLSQALNLDLVLVRGFWASLYHTYPDAQARMAGNEAVLEFFIQGAVYEYQGLLNSGQVAALNTQVITPLTGAVGSILSGVGSLVSALPSDISSLLGGVGAGVDSLASGVGGGVSSIAGGVGGSVGSLVSGVGSLVGSSLGSALTGVSGDVSSVLGGVGGGVGSIVSVAGGGVGTLLSEVGGGLGSLLGVGGGGSVKTSTSPSVPATATPAANVGLGASVSVPNLTPAIATTTNTVLAVSLAPTTVNVSSLLSSVSALSSSLLTPAPVSSASIIVVTYVTSGTSSGVILGVLGITTYTSTYVFTLTLASPTPTTTTLTSTLTSSSLSVSVTNSSPASSNTVIGSTRVSGSRRAPYMTIITSTYTTLSTSGGLLAIAATVLTFSQTTTFTTVIRPTAAAVKADWDESKVWAA